MIDKERTLLAGCLQGDKAAWDAFVLQYSSLVYHTIKKTLASFHVEARSDLVEDLFQDLFLALLRDDCRKLRQFRGERGCSLATWLRLVTSRLTIDFLRRQDSSSAGVEDTSPAQSDPSAVFVEREEEEAVSRAIEGLPSRDQLFVELCFRRNLPPQDVAGILKMSVNAVYTQKSRILDKIREALRKGGSL